MWKNYAWVGVAMLVPLGFLAGLLVFASREPKPANDSHVGLAGSSSPEPKAVAAPGIANTGPSQQAVPADAEGPGGPPPAAAKPNELVYAPNSTKMICQLTGDVDRAGGVPTLSETGKRFGILATDRGTSFEHRGRLYFLFGPAWDAWDRPGNLAAVAWTNSTDPENIVLDFHKGADGKWLAATLPGFPEGSALYPTGGVSIDDIMYVVFNLNDTSVLASSDDDGRTFKGIFPWKGGKILNVSFWPSGEWLYLYGRGEFRKSSVYLARAKLANIATDPRVEFFGGAGPNGQLRWSSRDTDAVPMFQHDAVGEFSVAYLEPVKRYVMLYDSDRPRGITMREAEAPWGPWSEGSVVFDPRRDNGYGRFMHSADSDGPRDALSDPNRNDESGAEYGPYLIARFTRPTDGGCRILYTMSTRNPHQVFLMSSDLKFNTAEQVPAGGIDIETERDTFGNKLDAFAKEVIDKRGIAGEVVMNGQPVPGARVVMRRISRKIADEAPGFAAVEVNPADGNAWTAETDAEGKYSFYGLEAGHYGIEAYTGTACGVDDMPVRPGSIPGVNPRGTEYYGSRGRMSIELRPSGPLSGRVLAPDGKPVADAAIYPIRVQYQNETLALDPIPAVLLNVKSGADGSFSFPRLVAGKWQLAIRAAGYPDKTSDWLPVGDQPVEVRLDTPRAATETSGQMIDGAVFKLSDYRGKYVLLDFWATWCGPCRAELPSIKAVYEEYKNDPRLVMIGMDLDLRAEDAMKYISDNGMGWTHVFLGESSKKAVLNQYGAQLIPCLILFDPEGKELARDMRGPAISETLHKFMNPPGKPGATDLPRQDDTGQQHGADVVAPFGAADTEDPPTVENGSGAASGTLDLNIDRDFNYVPEGWPLGMAVGQTEAPPLTDRPAETLSAEPAYHSANVRYGYLPLGNSEDNRFTFVLDDLDKETWTAYFDRNNNEDLTDDGPPLRNEGSGKFAATFTADVPVVLASGATVQRPYKLWLWSSETNANFYAVCHYRAEVNINGTRVTAIAFEQYNHDVLYKDAGIWLDLNADNKLDDKTELFKAGSTVTVKGQSLQVNLDYP